MDGKRRRKVKADERDGEGVTSLFCCSIAALLPQPRWRVEGTWCGLEVFNALGNMIVVA